MGSRGQLARAHLAGEKFGMSAPAATLSSSSNGNRSNAQAGLSGKLGQSLRKCLDWLDPSHGARRA